MTIVAGKEDKDEEADTLVGMENLGVLQGFFIWGFQGVMQWKTLAIIIYLLFVLDFAITSKYTPHLFTSEILLMAGVLVGLSLERLVGDIPQLWWAVFTW